MLRTICVVSRPTRNLQNALRDFDRVRIMVMVMVMVRFRVRVRVTFRSEICTLHTRNFEIAQRILQIAQIDKSRAT